MPYKSYMLNVYVFTCSQIAESRFGICREIESGCRLKITLRFAHASVVVSQSTYPVASQIVGYHQERFVSQ